MFELGKFNGFDWDGGNRDKSYEKHGVTTRETEEIFLDRNLQVKRDIEHSQNEDRYIAFGITATEKVLFVVFTLRQDKIRVVSARMANKSERSAYEKEIKKNSTF